MASIKYASILGENRMEILWGKTSSKSICLSFIIEILSLYYFFLRTFFFSFLYFALKSLVLAGKLMGEQQQTKYFSVTLVLSCHFSVRLCWLFVGSKCLIDEKEPFLVLPFVVNFWTDLKTVGIYTHLFE